MTWKLRSPSGLRSDKVRVDPAGLAGSTFVTVLTEASRSDQDSSRRS
jgi:hypothetical protein